MIHMIFYAPYPQIVPLIKQVFQERPDRNEIEYEIVQDFYNNPLQDLNADVVIARGFSALTMKQRGYICAELKVGGYDDHCCRPESAAAGVPGCLTLR